VGVDITYRYKRLKLGAVAVYTQYNGTLVHDGAPRHAYAFEGDRLTNMGINYQYTFKNVFLYGESAKGYRSEEHTSELQSRENLVCRLLLEKKKKKRKKKK